MKTMTRYVLVHPEHGVFLGSALGLGFWSAEDPAGQMEAPTFPTEAVALAYPEKWDEPPVGEARAKYTARAIELPEERLNRDGSAYATIAEVAALGIPEWDPT